MYNYAAVVAAHHEARQIAQPIVDQALETIKKTSPHFVPAGYKCVWIADGQPTNRHFTSTLSCRHVGIGEDEYTLARQRCNDGVEFCFKNRLDKAQRNDVLIVITGIVPVNESAISRDEDTLKFVHENDIGLVLETHCFFQSELK